MKNLLLIRDSRAEPKQEPDPIATD
jgi:hypothetical protein